jgi:hypothetical protein
MSTQKTQRDQQRKHEVIDGLIYIQCLMDSNTEELGQSNYMIIGLKPHKYGQCLRFLSKMKGSQLVNEGIAVQIALEDSFSFDPPDHQMLQDPGKVYPCSPEHTLILPNPESPVNLFIYASLIPQVMNSKSVWTPG